MSDEPEPLERHACEAASLMAAHPPRVRNPNKGVVMEVARPPGAAHRGGVEVTRWAAMELPATVAPLPAVLVRPAPGYYDYAPPADPGVCEWHVNFADPHLFVAYAGGLFAQDEMQVAEHPALAAVREALLASGSPARTSGPNGPTPILVTGAERRVSVATDPDPSAGRPQGLYGNAFPAAAPEAIRRATAVIDPPTTTNLVAIAAIPGGWGPYSAAEIRTTLLTAWTGFRAAVLESGRLVGGGGASSPARVAGADAAVVVHTGYWGCGAFGGDRVLMALLQVVAAAMAGLRRLVFHTGAPGGGGPLAEGMAVLEELLRDGPIETAALLGAIEARGFRWGTGDAN